MPNRILVEPALLTKFRMLSDRFVGADDDPQPVRLGELVRHIRRFVFADVYTLHQRRNRPNQLESFYCLFNSPELRASASYLGRPDWHITVLGLTEGWCPRESYVREALSALCHVADGIERNDNQDSRKEADTGDRQEHVVRRRQGQRACGGEDQPAG